MTRDKTVDWIVFIKSKRNRASGSHEKLLLLITSKTKNVLK